MYIMCYNISDESYPINLITRLYVYVYALLYLQVAEILTMEKILTIY